MIIQLILSIIYWRLDFEIIIIYNSSLGSLSTFSLFFYYIFSLFFHATLFQYFLPVLSTDISLLYFISLLFLSVSILSLNTFYQHFLIIFYFITVSLHFLYYFLIRFSNFTLSHVLLLLYYYTFSHTTFSLHFLMICSPINFISTLSPYTFFLHFLSLLPHNNLNITL